MTQTKEKVILKPKRVYLCGFMGSGKTTIGQILAQRIGASFLDSDHFIEESQGHQVGQLIRDLGEQAFRQLEKKAVRQLSRVPEPAVVALGGGSLMDTENLMLVRKSGILIYIKNSLPEIKKRLSGDRTRPLLENSSIEELLAKRIDGYEKADIIVEGDLTDPDALAGAILVRLTELTIL